MSWFGEWDGFDEEMQNAPDIFARKPQTNYDRIISKTPEELADWIIGVIQRGGVIPYGGTVMTLDWLKQEATE